MIVRGIQKGMGWVWELSSRVELLELLFADLAKAGFRGSWLDIVEDDARADEEYIANVAVNAAGVAGLDFDVGDFNYPLERLRRQLSGMVKKTELLGQTLEAVGRRCARNLYEFFFRDGEIDWWSFRINRVLSEEVRYHDYELDDLAALGELAWRNADMAFVFERRVERKTRNSKRRQLITKRRIVVFEYTLGGSSHYINALLSVGKAEELSLLLKQGYVPPKPSYVDVRYWKSDLVEFAREYIERAGRVVDRALDNWGEFTVSGIQLGVYDELFKFLQALVYGLSYLGYDIKRMLKEGRVPDLWELTVWLLYPVSPGMKYDAFLKGRNVDAETADVLLELAGKGLSIRERRSEIARVDGSSRVFIEEVAKKFDSAQKDSLSFVMKPKYGMDRVRSEVARLIREASWGDALILCHPAGSGKTTNVLKRFIDELQSVSSGKADYEGCVLVYITTRVQVEEDKYRHLKKLIEQHELTHILPPKAMIKPERQVLGCGDERNVSAKLHQLNIKQEAGTFGRSAGRIKRASELLKELNFQENRLSAAIFLTLQSFNDVAVNNSVASPPWRFANEIVAHAVKHNRKVIIMVDEFAADTSGLYYLKRMVDELYNASKLFDNHAGNESRLYDNVLLIVSDANLLCGAVADRFFGRALDAMEVAKSSGAEFWKRVCVPSTFEEVSGEEILSTLDGYESEVLRRFFKGFKRVRAYGMPSFPVAEGGCIEVHVHTRLTKGGRSLQDSIRQQVEEVKNFLSRWYGSRVFVVWLYREALKMLESSILKGQESKKGENGLFEPHEVIRIQSNYGSYKQDRVSDPKVKVVLATSTVGRGVDMPHFDKALIVVPTFEVEQLMMEFYQICCRLRGEKNLPDKREIHLLVFGNLKSTDIGTKLLGRLAKGTKEQRDLENQVKAEMVCLFDMAVKVLEAYIAPDRNQRYVVPVLGVNLPDSPEYEEVLLLSEDFERLVHERLGNAGHERVMDTIAMESYKFSEVLNIGWPYKTTFLRPFLFFADVEKLRDVINEIEELIKKEQQHKLPEDLRREREVLERVKAWLEQFGDNDDAFAIDGSRKSVFVSVINEAMGEILKRNPHIHSIKELRVMFRKGLRHGATALKGHIIKLNSEVFDEGVSVPFLMTNISNMDVVTLLPTVPISFWSEISLTDLHGSN